MGDISNLQIDIGKAIRNGLEKHHMIQRDLAEMLGKSVSLVSEWTRGVKIPSGDDLIRVAIFLDIVSELFPGYTVDDSNPRISNNIQAQIRFPFAYSGGVPHNATDLEVYDVYGILSQVPVPRPGSMVTLEIFSAEPIISGSLSVTPTINGVKTPTDLSATISAGIVHAVTEIPPGKPGFEFTSSQLLGLVLTTSPDWKNSKGYIVANLHVQI